MTEYQQRVPRPRQDPQVLGWDFVTCCSNSKRLAAAAGCAAIISAVSALVRAPVTDAIIQARWVACRAQLRAPCPNYRLLAQFCMNVRHAAHTSHVSNTPPHFDGHAGEFVAHEGAVNCLRIGRNTAGVLATGGEDKKVNLWRIGQHEAPIKVRPASAAAGAPNSPSCCATTANKAVMLCSCNMVWCMVGRSWQCVAWPRLGRHTLAEHITCRGNLAPANTKCCHPLGMCACVQTLAGLQTPVECVQFDSSENQVAAGTTNGTVKVWDLETGKGGSASLVCWTVSACVSTGAGQPPKHRQSPLW